MSSICISIFGCFGYMGAWRLGVNMVLIVLLTHAYLWLLNFASKRPCYVRVWAHTKISLIIYVCVHVYQYVFYYLSIPIGSCVYLYIFLWFIWLYTVIEFSHCSVHFSQQGVVQNVTLYFSAVRAQCRKRIGMATWHWYTFGLLNWMVLQLCLSRDSGCWGSARRCQEQSVIQYKQTLVRTLPSLQQVTSNLLLQLC